MYPEIRKFYSEHGYSSSKDAAQITVLGWARYRSENTSGPLSERVLVKLSQSFGRLTVKSHPPGAAVEVDGMLWDGTTEVTDWTTADKHPVKLTKEGCGPEKGEVVVPAAGDVTFEMTLKCKK
jgi:hypothetical protein